MPRSSCIEKCSNNAKSQPNLNLEILFKLVTVASTWYGQQPIRKTKRYIKDKGGRVDIHQPNSTAEYNKAMGGLDRMDQNIWYYMIKILNKKWWGPLFRLCINLAVNNAF